MLRSPPDTAKSLGAPSRAQRTPKQLGLTPCTGTFPYTGQIRMRPMYPKHPNEPLRHGCPPGRAEPTRGGGQRLSLVDDDPRPYRVRVRLPPALLAGALLASAARAAPRDDQDARPVVIAGVTVIDGTGAPPRANVDVVIDSGRITAIGPAGRVRSPKRARRVDGRGRWLIPGLWDMHTHALPTSASMLALYVANGVTGVRDMGTELPLVLDWRRKIAAGMLVGPRIVAAGAILDVPNIPLHLGVPRAADARRIVDSLAAAGADFIKVHQRLPRETYFAVAQAAKRTGLPLVGHVPSSVTAAEASAAGQRSFEHLLGVPLLCTPEERASYRATTWQERLLGRCETAGDSAIFRALREQGTWQVPTFVVKRAMVDATDGLGLRDPAVAYAPRDVRALWADTTMFPRYVRLPDSVRANVRRLYRKQLDLVGAMHRAGIRVLAGTDAPTPGVVPGWSLHAELEALVETGLTPAEALAAATRGPAEFLGALDSLGTIQVGKRADLVLLEANPLADIRHTRRIAAVIADGRVIDARARQQILARARSAAEDPSEHKGSSRR